MYPAQIGIMVSNLHSETMSMTMSRHFNEISDRDVLCAQFRVPLERGPFTQHLGSALFQPEFPRSFNGQGRHSLRGSFCG